MTSEEDGHRGPIPASPERPRDPHPTDPHARHPSPRDAPSSERRPPPGAGWAAVASPWRLFVAFALLHLLFATWPALDLHVSAVFFDGEAFPAARSPTLDALRHAVWNATIIATLAGLLAWLVWLALGWRARVAPRVLGYPVALMVLGPGLVVNGILKTHWGRARPADVVPFGGEAAFTPPFEIAGECARNCSFVSGEGAGAVALALGLGALTDSTRARIALTALAALASLLRVAKGRHFLSDVIFGAFLMAFLAILLYRLMRIGPARRTLTRRNLAHDLGLLAAPFRRS